MEYDIKDSEIADQGRLRVSWASRGMSVLEGIRERFERERPLQGVRISACLHITAETANLARALKGGGAEVVLCASNPLSTQDDVAAYLVEEQGIPVFAVRGEDSQRYYEHIRRALEFGPTVTMDDGADLVSSLHFIALGKWGELSPAVRRWAEGLSSGKREELVGRVIGGTEETTTGVIRLRSMEAGGVLQFPIIAINDADSKHFFDNRYGTGQSTIDGIIRATNRLIAGSVFVVCGYGWCGKGLAMRARGMGAHVVVTEVDPLRALEAVMDGYQVMPISEAAGVGDIFCTVSGDVKVIGRDDFGRMKDGAIVANSGHFDVELDLEGLGELSVSKRKVREHVEEHVLEGGRRIYVLGQGRLINLASAEGHPSSVMDMSFSNQALGVEYLTLHGRSLEKRVYRVPVDIDRAVAQMKLESMGVRIDQLTEEQQRYLASWEKGT
ncbi:MAG: adenosylhomocysteinase [Syntrophobacterales bacterium]|nr:MAG: adenosylhomocysteinase [Syntrophobacterales bacterium]